MEDWLHKLFINEAKPALDRHSNSGSTGGDGTPGLDTSDATATPSDILEGKTAYVDGERVTGNITVAPMVAPLPLCDSYPQVRDDMTLLGCEMPVDVYAREGTIVETYFPSLYLGNATPDKVRSGITFTSMNGMYLVGTFEPYEPKFQIKSVVMTETAQTITPDDGFDALSEVNVTAGQFDCDESTSGAHFILETRRVFGRADYLFHNCSKLSEVPLFDTSWAETMAYMFHNCLNLTTVPLFDTSKVTDMSLMFYNCQNLTTVPLFDTSKVTSMKNMFYNCLNLTTVPPFDMSNVIYMANMFSACESLTTISALNTSSATSMMGLFSNCKALTTAPSLDMSLVSSTVIMFSNCESLTTVPAYDMQHVEDTSSMFSSCKSLSECWLRNIRTNLQVGSGSNYGHLLTVDSILHLIQELHQRGVARTLTIGSANLAKISDIYVKLIDITDDMRTEDEYIDLKKPFEICESTDESAMNIADYAYLKQWQIQ